MAETTTLVENTVRVTTEDLDGSALSGGSGGDTSAYDATSADGALIAAPNAATPDTFTPAFTTGGFTVYVEVAAVNIRISFDSGSNYGDWIRLLAGIHGYDGFSATNIQIREAVDDAGAQYQIVAVT